MKKEKIGLIEGIKIIVISVFEFLRDLVMFIAYIILQIYLLFLWIITISLMALAGYIFWKTIMFLI